MSLLLLQQSSARKDGNSTSSSASRSMIEIRSLAVSRDTSGTLSDYACCHSPAVHTLFSLLTVHAFNSEGLCSSLLVHGPALGSCCFAVSLPQNSLYWITPVNPPALCSFLHQALCCAPPLLRMLCCSSLSSQHTSTRTLRMAIHSRKPQMCGKLQLCSLLQAS
jgi:hypothetical protein